MQTTTGLERRTLPNASASTATFGSGAPRLAPDFGNGDRVPYPVRRVSELFEEQAARTPDAIALRFRDQTFTYAELNARANQLARFLQQEGVRTETLVALCVERSAEMLIGLLAILKAGGTYLPLDILYPKDRIALMLEDAQAPLLLTQSPLAPSLPATAAQVVRLDAEAETLTALPTENLGIKTPPDALAYVIYTSGSTGRPKGVQIAHRSLVNLLWDMRARLAMTGGDTLVAVTTIAFDIAALEMFLPLILGGCVALAPREVASDGKALASLIAGVGATIMQATPATWRLLVETGWRGDPGFKILCGGEPLPPTLAQSLLRGDTEVWNVYGPTETTIWSTAKRLESDDAKISIGRPIANTRIYLLDEAGREVLFGEIGRLFIGGDGVARGYLNRPELTAERFVPDPFSDEPGARMYFTGDLARWLPDGDLEFLGRIDHQIKIRGFRVELGEIEAVLSSHSTIREAVVTAREDAPGDVRLVAYVTLKDGAKTEETSPLVRTLRALAAERLPDYMVPSAFVPLDALPLTPNGKIDRAALPAPDFAVCRERPLVPAQNWLQNQLVHIWEEAFGVAPLGIDDDFLELGGHSLLAGRIVAAIAQTLHKDLSLAALLDAPTIRQQAEVVQRLAGADQWNSLVALKPEGSRPPLFGIHAGMGVVMFYRHLARSLPPEQPFYGLQQQGLNGRRTSLTCIEDMAAHYLCEIRRVQPHGPYRLVGYCFGGLIAYEMAQQFHKAGETVELLALINAPTPDFDFSRGRPLPPETPEAATPTAKAVCSAPPQGHWLWRKIKNGVSDRYRRLKFYSTQGWERCVCRLTLALGQTIPWERRMVYTKAINAAAERRYRPLPYPGRILVIRAEGLYHDPTLGWRNLAQGGLQLREVTGKHELVGSIMLEPHVACLAALIEQEVRKSVRFG